jgi:pilus assembly protein FimV
MKKLFCALLFYVSIFSSTLCNALSLGEIHIESALNQALRATIQIGNAGDFNSEEIIVRIAEKQKFNKAGIEYLHFYNQLKFIVSKTDENSATVKVQSHDAVVEPFLNFIIEVRTPQGRSFKQYTLLVEPKSY